MSYKSSKLCNEKPSFIKALGDAARPKPPSISKLYKKGFGSSDTMARNTNIVSLVDDKHFDAMAYRQRKKVSQVSNQYLLEDTKSRVGNAYQEMDYVAVTRERLAQAPETRSHFGMVASRPAR